MQHLPGCAEAAPSIARGAGVAQALTSAVTRRFESNSCNGPEIHFDPRSMPTRCGNAAQSSRPLTRCSNSALRSVLTSRRVHRLRDQHCPSAVFRTWSRDFAPVGGVANPRDATGHRCGSRLAPRANTLAHKCRSVRNTALEAEGRWPRRPIIAKHHRTRQGRGVLGRQHRWC
jgi:hypothetical protein